jgi:hypothetical protein
LWPFGYLVAIWYIFPPDFGIVCQEKSGNPGLQHKKNFAAAFFLRERRNQSQLGSFLPKIFWGHFLLMAASLDKMYG